MFLCRRVGDRSDQTAWQHDLEIIPVLHRGDPICEQYQPAANPTIIPSGYVEFTAPGEPSSHCAGNRAFYHGPHYDPGQL